MNENNLIDKMSGFGEFINQCGAMAEENWWPSQVEMLERLFGAVLKGCKYDEWEPEDKKVESMTVMEIIDEVNQEICDGYCKYTNMPIPEGKDEDWLIYDDDSPCNSCPLNKLH